MSVQRKIPKLGVGADELIPLLDQVRAETDIPTRFSKLALQQAQNAADEWNSIAELLTHKPIDWAAHLADVKRPVEAVRQLPTLQLPDVQYLHRDALPVLDATALPFVTIDPEESRDLDQALLLTDVGGGSRGKYLVNYAIASVSTFVHPGSQLDTETWERGTTIYLPDKNTPLHPPELSHGAASLLPNQVRPACVWSILLDEDGHAISSRVDRAIVRSREKLSYEQVDAAWRGQGTLPATVPTDMVDLLEQIGKLRLAREVARGGVSARIPEQIFESDDDWYTVQYRSNRPIEEWNAQLSLLTGIRAAHHMRAMNTGIMRTLPPARSEDISRLRRVAQALGVDWPLKESYPDLVRKLDPADPAHAAFLLEATTLFRGAGYRSFGVKDTRPLPRSAADGIIHAAIAAEYAHVTAPLRRLVDRYGEEICIAHSAHRETPQWVRDALDDLPVAMARTTGRASQVAKRALTLLEALMMRGHENREYTGVVVDVNTKKSKVMLRSPAVTGVVYRRLKPGYEGSFRVESVDLKAREILLEPV
ncbi:MAG: RNB domain-containing ribonuclease [Actinomycetaceae bacterium]|nr:RNB domain-containing ribonuclease [Actinomycetaceae bacterium]